MICSYIPPCREHSAWQMLGLFLCVTLNVSEWHLTDDTLLVEQVLVARTIFREQRSKNGSVISRSDFSLSQDLSPLLSLLTNSPEWENQGVLPKPPAEEPWDLGYRTQTLPRKGDLHVRGASRSIHYRLLFFYRKHQHCSSFCLHSPRVTVVRSRRAHLHRLSNTVHFWPPSVGHFLTLYVPTLQTQTQSWGKCERTSPGLAGGSKYVQVSLQDNWTTLGGFSVCSCPATFSLLSTRSCRSNLLCQEQGCFWEPKGNLDLSKWHPATSTPSAMLGIWWLTLKLHFCMKVFPAITVQHHAQSLSVGLHREYARQGIKTVEAFQLLLSLKIWILSWK